MSGLPPPGIRQVVTHLPRAEADHRDRPLAAVRDVEELRVAARVEPVRAATGAEEAGHPQPRGRRSPRRRPRSCRRRRRRAVGRELDVLRHRAGPSGSWSVPTTRSRGDVDLQHRPGELAARDQVAPVRGEVHVVDARAGHVQRVVQPEAAAGRGSRVGAGARRRRSRSGRRREVQVVGVVDRDRPARAWPVRGSIGVRLLPASFVHVERPQVPRRRRRAAAARRPGSGRRPCSVFGSITSTVSLSLFGT